MYPPEEDLKNPDPNVKDYLNKKQINWWDFVNTNYTIEYSTSSVQYRKSTLNRDKIANFKTQNINQYFSGIYNNLYKFDNMYTNVFFDSIVNIQLIYQNEVLNKIQTNGLIETYSGGKLNIDGKTLINNLLYWNKIV